MLELEDRIRAEVTRQSEAYLPPADLPARIEARARQRRLQRRSIAGVAAAATLVVAAGLASILANPTEDEVIIPGSSSSTAPPSVTAGPSTSPPKNTSTTEPGGDATGTTGDPTVPGDTAPPTPPGSVTPSTPADPEPPAGPVPTDGMPLHRRGLGPITAGMTLRQAAEASGTTITPDEPIGPTSTCNTALIEGTSMRVIVTTSGDPAADPMDGVIQQVNGGRSTAEGVRLGDTAEEVTAVLGPPTETQQSLYDSTYLIFEQGGYAYVITVGAEGTVIEMSSGYPTIYSEGCA